MSSAPTAYVAFPITKSSSVSASASTYNDISSTNKKKFGKNLSKIVKQPEPLSSDTTNSSKSLVSRNGLLLLSTKRVGPLSSSLTSGLLNSKTSAAPKPINTSSLKSEIGSSLIGNYATNPYVWQRNHLDIDETQQDALVSNDNFYSNAPEESAGRHDATTDMNFYDGIVEDQTVTVKQETQDEYMARLAKERSEKRKTEEEIRIREQREKAERRLMDLDSKRTSSRQSIKKQPNSDTVLQKSFNTKQGDGDTMDVYAHETDFVDRSSHRDEFDSPNERESVKITGSSRKLFDPYRTSSALAGKISMQPHVIKANNNVILMKDKDCLTEKGDSNERSEPLLVQISSHDDITRGDRRNIPSTRMLFDPKSGAMVSVRIREDSESSRPKKENGKIKKGGSKEKERDPNKKKELKDKKKHRKRDERKDGLKEDESLQYDQTLNLSRLPRTCGVLYKRELDGSVISVDGCDGDQGFGSHSVPGGRMKNAIAHNELIDEQLSLHISGINGDHFNEATFDEHANNFSNGSPAPDFSLGHKLTREHFMKAQFSKKKDGTDYNTNADIPWNLRVKPNEKIELVTGIDESPTLQATAAAWAPSLSTMAALKQALSRSQTPDRKLESHSDVSSELDEISESEVPALTLFDLDGSYEEMDGEDEELSPSLSGLGFDLTLNMDSVMMSPTFGRSDVEPPLNIDSLILTDSAVKHFNNLNEVSSSTHFLNSVWPSTGSLGNLNNWEYLRNNTKSSTVDEIPLSLNVLPATPALSFLPISSTQGEQVNASTSTHSILDHW